MTAAVTTYKGRARGLMAVALLLLPCGAMAEVAGGAKAAAHVESVSPANADSAMQHLVLGHTLFLNTQLRLKRVYVSNPEVLTSLTASPYQVLITAKSAGMSSVVLWDESGQSTVYTVSADVDVEGLRQALKAALPKQQIEVSALQNRIELSGVVETQAQADTALKLAQPYGKDISDSLTIQPPRVRQVELKVRFIEVDRVKLGQFGINLLTLGNNVATTSTNQYTSFSGIATATATTAATATISNPLNLLLYNQSLNIGAAIQDLEEKQVVQILAEPTITSISGETASFLSGGEFPFPVVQGGSGSYASVTVQFRPYGVKLDFTPTVNADGTIRLKVAPEVSALDYTNEVVISGYDIPALSTRRAQTEVELRNGQSFAISGLLDHRLTDAFSKTPGIASIPILGDLFKSKSTNHSTVELLVVVTPTIVDPLSTPTPVVEPKPTSPYLDQKVFDNEVHALTKKNN